MKSSKLFGLAILSMAGSLLAGNNPFTVGLISSHFHNDKSGHRMNEMRNPFGYGLLVGYTVNENLTFSATGELLDGNMEMQNGNESSMRTSLSASVFPFQWSRIRPYVSGGLVFTRQKLAMNNQNDETNHLLEMRESLGVDVLLLPGIALNVDAAIYSDGLNYQGVVNSLGFRYIF